MSEAPEHEAGDLTADALVIDTAPADDTPAPSGAQADIEAAALKGGWVPKEKYEGDADKWLDAPSFVLKAAEILPHVTRELREARGEIKEVKRTLKQFGEHHSKTAQREYNRALSDIQARIDHAASTGDVQGVRDATDELVDLRNEATPTAQPEMPAELQAFIDENPWYGKDKALTAAAQALGQEVFEEGYTGKAQVAEVTKRLKEQFPAKFEKPKNPNRELPGAVEGAGAPRRTNGKGYSDLPPEAKAMCDDFVKRVPGFTRDRYVKEYFA